MRTNWISVFFYILLACSPEKEDSKVSENLVPSNLDKSENSYIDSFGQEEEQHDMTDDLYERIKNIFSGSWMDMYESIDGEREVSWGIVPFSNQSYFIIDFQNGNQLIIKGATEGGGKGFDRYIGEVFKIEENIGMYRFFYKNIISTHNPNRTHEIVLRYNPENDTMAIIGYGDNVYENPSEMIRISEPLHK